LDTHGNHGTSLIRERDQTDTSAMRDQPTGPNSIRLANAEFSSCRLAMALLLATGVTATGGFALSVLLVHSAPSNDGCRPGCRWAPGTWRNEVQLWALALPALALAVLLIWPVATARRQNSSSAVDAAPVRDGTSRTARRLRRRHRW
jgi:hypothetical protein